LIIMSIMRSTQSTRPSLSGLCHQNRIVDQHIDLRSKVFQSPRNQSVDLPFGSGNFSLIGDRPHHRRLLNQRQCIKLVLAPRAKHHACARLR